MIEYFEKASCIPNETTEMKLKCLSTLYNILEAIQDEEFKQNKENVDQRIIALLNGILVESNRSKSVGNLITKFYLERSLEFPINLINSESTLSNLSYFTLFQKTFVTHILDEGSFENIKILAKTLHKKENYSFFMKNQGIEFIYSVLISNLVFMDDVIPTKSILMVLDAVFLYSRGDDLKSVFKIFFSKDTQDKIGFLMNFMSNFISLMMVHLKIESNPDMINVLSSNKFYLSILFILKQGDEFPVDDSLFRFVLILFKFEFYLYKWHVENKRQQDYKKRIVICHTISNLLPLKEIPLWFFDEFFQFLIWNGKHLGCLYPYSRSNVSITMNEGPCANMISKYSTIHKISVSFNPELLESFFSLSFTQENQSNRIYIIKKFLDAVQDKQNELLISRDFFWTLSRLRAKHFPDMSIENFVGPHLGPFLINLLVFELQKEVIEV